jgi:hypothetical protein
MPYKLRRIVGKQDYRQRTIRDAMEEAFGEPVKVVIQKPRGTTFAEVSEALRAVDFSELERQMLAFNEVLADRYLHGIFADAIQAETQDRPATQNPTDRV